ncbi:hypothetical protein H5410_059877 [Solanum commersonii]|uniref:Uncharacterized protein n=1 Tax=Solanum commersonii TaxID=4109 RepID=A0A9J5W3Y7_SOLCO|nr:hypothetical protein H5410_059877 [Solanum commersonii]
MTLVRDFFSFTSQNRRKTAIVFIDGTTGTDLQLRPSTASWLPLVFFPFDSLGVIFRWKNRCPPLLVVSVAALGKVKMWEYRDEEKYRCSEPRDT